MKTIALLALAVAAATVSVPAAAQFAKAEDAIEAKTIAASAYHIELSACFCAESNVHQAQAAHKKRANLSRPMMNTAHRKPLAGTALQYFDAHEAVEQLQPGAWAQLPYTARVHAENLVRRADPAQLNGYLTQLIERRRDQDFPWFPVRVVCHDILGRPRWSIWRACATRLRKRAATQPP